MAFHQGKHRQAVGRSPVRERRRGGDRWLRISAGSGRCTRPVMAIVAMQGPGGRTYGVMTKVTMTVCPNFCSDGRSLPSSSKETLLPALIPLAPAATVVDRFVTSLGPLLAAHGIDRALVDEELAGMKEHRLATTSNRSVLGIMNAFAYLAKLFTESAEASDLGTISMDLAGTPCGPLYKRHVTPRDELKALLARRSF